MYLLSTKYVYFFSLLVHYIWMMLNKVAHNSPLSISSPVSENVQCNNTIVAKIFCLK